LLIVYPVYTLLLSLLGKEGVWFWWLDPVVWQGMGMIILPSSLLRKEGD
jgi:hypothetical protein